MQHHVRVPVSCSLNIHFLSDPPTAARGLGAFDARSIGCRLICVNQPSTPPPLPPLSPPSLCSRPPSSPTANPSLPLPPPPPAADNTPPEQVSGCWRRGDCLTLLFAFASSLFFPNKGFFNKLKGPPPPPARRMKGTTELCYNVAKKKREKKRSSSSENNKGAS